MRNKKFVLVIVFLITFVVNARADKLYLKNGGVLEGIVKDEDNDSVEFEVNIGFVKFRKSEIEQIERESIEEIARLRERWQEKKIRDEQKTKVWAEQERLKKERAPKEVKVNKKLGYIIVNAFLNKKINATLIVDTGASGVLLSKDIGDKLGIMVDKAAGKKNPIVQISLADGRKAEARYVVLESVKVEDVEVNNVEGAILLDDKADITYDGLLGMSFLNKFNFKFNQKEGKLVLEKIQ